MTTSITPPTTHTEPSPVVETGDRGGFVRERGRWLRGWNPDDPVQWEQGGHRVARRNLYGSIYAEFLGFCVWALWSVTVPMLPQAGFVLSVDQQFWLIAVPSLVGAAMRIPYTFTVPILGDVIGRSFLRFCFLSPWWGWRGRCRTRRSVSRPFLWWQVWQGLGEGTCVLNDQHFVLLPRT